APAADEQLQHVGLGAFLRRRRGLRQMVERAQPGVVNVRREFFGQCIHGPHPPTSSSVSLSCGMSLHDGESLRKVRSPPSRSAPARGTPPGCAPASRPFRGGGTSPPYRGTTPSRCRRPTSAASAPRCAA